MNIHKDMILKEIWFKPTEHKKLINALNSGDNDKVLNILFDIHKRGDLWNLKTQWLKMQSFYKLREK